MALIVRPAMEADLNAIRTIAHSYGNLVSWPQRPAYLDQWLHPQLRRERVASTASRRRRGGLPPSSNRARSATRKERVPEPEAARAPALGLL